MEKDTAANLSLILDSRWAKPYNSNVLEFYQKNSYESYPVKYGLYSYNLDRFLIVDSLDLWAISETAQILSSKLALVVCVFTVPPPNDFKIENCLCWDLSEKEFALPIKQTPTIALIKSENSINKLGPPVDFKNQLAKLVLDQEFALFTLKSIVAARLTQLFFNHNTEINNVDQSYYLKFFSDEKNNLLGYAAHDKTEWQNVFAGNIYSILYKSQSIKEALMGFTNLIPTNFDSDLYKYQRSYLNYFFRHLNWEPQNAE
jgi:hypothetical protein